MATALILAIGAYTRRRDLRRADERLVAHGQIDMRADEARLEVRQADLSNGFPWTHFALVEETPSHVFLFLGPESAIVVPRIAVAGTALGALLAEKARGAARTSPAAPSQ